MILSEHISELIDVERVPVINPSNIISPSGIRKIHRIVKRTMQDAHIQAKIKHLIAEKITMKKIPYIRGVVYYFVDQKSRNLIVFVPVKRRTLKVGRAILDLEEDLNKALKGWNVEVYTKRYLNPESWGVSKDSLWKIEIKK